MGDSGEGADLKRGRKNQEFCFGKVKFEMRAGHPQGERWQLGRGSGVWRAGECSGLRLKGLGVACRAAGMDEATEGKCRGGEGVRPSSEEAGKRRKSRLGKLPASCQRSSELVGERGALEAGPGHIRREMPRVVFELASYGPFPF